MTETEATTGMFDGVHRGHRDLIAALTARAAEAGRRPIVFTFDRHPLELIRPESAPRLLMPVDRRVETIRALGVDDVRVIHFDETMRALDAASFINLLHIRHNVTEIVMGFNHRFGSDRLTDRDDYRRAAASSGVGLVFPPEYRLADGSPVSSSIVREALACGDAARASELLGRPYRIEGTVVHGQKIGRTIGFPTANIKPREPRQLVPLNGVYAADVTVDGATHRAMLNIGRRPTVGNEGPISIEANIIGFDGDLYGRDVAVDFVARLRDERRFDSLDELAAQLAADRTAAIKA